MLAAQPTMHSFVDVWQAAPAASKLPVECNLRQMHRFGCWCPEAVGKRAAWAIEGPMPRLQLPAVHAAAIDGRGGARCWAPGKHALQGEAQGHPHPHSLVRARRLVRICMAPALCACSACLPVSSLAQLGCQLQCTLLTSSTYDEPRCTSDWSCMIVDLCLHSPRPYVVRAGMEDMAETAANCSTWSAAWDPRGRPRVCQRVRWLPAAPETRPRQPWLRWLGGRPATMCVLRSHRPDAQTSNWWCQK
jgi:hypothetical protein